MRVRKFVRGVDAVQVFPENAHELRQARARADEDRVVTFLLHQLVNRDRTAHHHHISLELDPHRAHVVGPARG